MCLRHDSTTVTLTSTVLFRETDVSRAMYLLLAAVLSLTGLAIAPSVASEPAAASLSVSPANGQFTAGQQLTLTGSMGKRGKRDVHVQSNMMRPGDIWRDISGTTARTNTAGNFTIQMPAPAMYGIALRVTSGSRSTPSFTSQVLHQGLGLSVDGGNDRLEQDQGIAGIPLTITARSLSVAALAGRPVTLQRRVNGTQWTHVADGQLDATGTVSWTTTPTAAGVEVFRAVADDWTGGGSRVGWFPSFPHYVTVLAEAPAEGDAQARTTAAEPTSMPFESSRPARAAPPAQATAGRTYRWGSARFDFDWEYGESLTSKPGIATVPRGRWIDSSSGTGRAALYNGALQMDVGSSTAYGPLGNTVAHLSGNAQPYGRWETRVQPMGFGAPGTGFALHVQLVPADSAKARCGNQAITVFRVSPGAPEPQIGALSSSGGSWTRQVPGVTANNAFHAYAVEVTPKKITWFVDGKVVGKVSDPEAISGEPLTVRVSTEAVATQSRVQGARTLVDWVRAWPTGTGSKTRGGVSLTRGTHSTAC